MRSIGKKVESHYCVSTMPARGSLRKVDSIPRKHVQVDVKRYVDAVWVGIKGMVGRVTIASRLSAVRYNYDYIARSVHSS